MGLTNKKEEQLKKMPVIETKFFKSKNNRFIVHQTITTIRPVEYFEKVLQSEGTVDENDLPAADIEVLKGSDLIEA